MILRASPFVVLFVALFAGPLWAGERQDAAAAGTVAPLESPAWIGHYRVKDAHGERRMIVVRDATRIEYRIEGQPVQVWRRVADGVELQELHLGEGKAVTHAPGDLRARNREPAWDQVSGLVDPSLRTRLTPGRRGQAFGEATQTYRGKDTRDHRVELDWLPAAGLPSRYRIKAGEASESLELQDLRRVPGDQAFTNTATLRESDGADDGD